MGSDNTIIVFNFVYIFAICLFCERRYTYQSNRKGSLRVGYACNLFSIEVFMSMVCLTST